MSGSQEGFDLYLEGDCVVVKLALDNRSAEFVHDITVTLFTLDGQDSGAELRVDTLPPETKAPMLAVFKPNGKYLDGLRTRMAFTDASGTRWLVEYGRPVREVR